MLKKVSLLEGKLAAAERGSKLLKNEGSCISIICTKEEPDISNMIVQQDEIYLKCKIMMIRVIGLVLEQLIVGLHKN